MQPAGSRPHRDLVIETMAYEIGALEHALVTRTVERDVYREMVSVALAQLHAATLRLRRQQELQRAARDRQSNGVASR